MLGFHYFNKLAQKALRSLNNNLQVKWVEDGLIWLAKSHKPIVIWHDNVTRIKACQLPHMFNIIFPHYIVQIVYIEIHLNEVSMQCFFQVYTWQGLHSLEKSLNCRGSPWKVLEFHFPWKVLEFSSTLNVKSGLESVFNASWLSKTEYKSKLREVKGDLLKLFFVFCAKINYQYYSRQVNWKR